MTNGKHPTPKVSSRKKPAAKPRKTTVKKGAAKVLTKVVK